MSETRNKKRTGRNKTGDSRKKSSKNNTEVNEMPESDTVEILDCLKRAYPDAGCALKHRNVYELIICVVLSAQTTDVSVNKVTRGGTDEDIESGLTVRKKGEGLFDLYPTPEKLKEAEIDDVMEIIHTIGMYRTKAKNIIKLADCLCERYGGEVPKDYDALVELPGVGRKTANVVLSVGFGQQRIAVDTHVFRVSHRIGLAGIGSRTKSGKQFLESDKQPAEFPNRNRKSGEQVDEEAGDIGNATKKNSAKSAGAAEVLATEHELMERIPEDRWTEAHHSLIWHGRKCCTARNPKCDQCPVNEFCYTMAR